MSTKKVKLVDYNEDSVYTLEELAEEVLLTPKQLSRILNELKIRGVIVQTISKSGQSRVGTFYTEEDKQKVFATFLHI